jgi:mannose-6-phosphate isomerase-like protein (cupin superfamily)
MRYQSINFKEKRSRFDDRWSPKVIARMNDTRFKPAKFQGQFVRHRHADTEEVFIVLEGEMSIDFRDGSVTVRAGELFVVPKGVEHRPVADQLCKALLVEPAGTINTGDAGGDMTAADDVWI